MAGTNRRMNQCGAFSSNISIQLAAKAILKRPWSHTDYGRNVLLLCNFIFPITFLVLKNSFLYAAYQLF